jgi:DNA-binding GntR family transcriptional regulator
MIDRANPKPLYQQIEGVIRGRITSRQWPKSYKLKAEDELAEEFGVSRGTLRQALQTLVEEGMLTQVQGKGTFVSAPSGDLPLAQRLITMHEALGATGQDFTTELLAQEVARGPDDVRALLDLPADEELLYLHRRLTVEDEPFVALHNWVRIALCLELWEVDFSTTALFEALENLCGLDIGWGHRNFTATTAGDNAGLLKAQENEPVLHLEQITYLSDGRPLEYSNVWVRGEKLRLTTILSRNTDPKPNA